MGNDRNPEEQDEFVDVFGSFEDQKYDVPEEPTDDPDPDPEEPGDDTPITDPITDPEDAPDDEPTDGPEFVQGKTSNTPEKPTDDIDTESLNEYGTVMQNLAESDVIEFDTEKEYEQSAEGFQEIIKDTVTAAKTSALDDFRDGLDDDAKEVFDAFKNGQSLTDFYQEQNEIDFSKIPLEAQDGTPHTSNMKNLVEDYYKMQNWSDDDIQDKLSSLEQSGFLEKEAKIAKNKLAENQVKTREDRVKATENAQKAQAEEKVKEEAAFKERVLGLKEIAGFKLPNKKAAEELYDYITKPGKDGKTQFAEEDTEEYRLLYAYLRKTGFTKQTLEKQVKSKANLKLKKKLSNQQDSNSNRKAGEKQVRHQTDTGDKIPFLGMI